MLSTNDSGGPDGSPHQPANGHTFKGYISPSDIPPENFHHHLHRKTEQRSGRQTDAVNDSSRAAATPCELTATVGYLSSLLAAPVPFQPLKQVFFDLQ